MFICIVFIIDLLLNQDQALCKMVELQEDTYPVCRNPYHTK